MKKTNQRLFSPLLLLLAAMALLAFGVFTNVLTDIWGPSIKEQLQHNAWLIAAFALLLAIVGYLYANQSSRAENTTPKAIDTNHYDEAFDKFRVLLLEQYQLRLNSKTSKRLPINLSAISTRFGFDPARAEIFLSKQTIESVDIASEIGKILATHQRLLLIGDPGAGKTTVLLYAAVNILNHAQEAKLPLILNLATWQKYGGFVKQDFATWYTQSIAHVYGLSMVFVEELLRRNAIVPFFDGFDEVLEYSRDDCFQKMTAYFGDHRNRQLIVSSRKEEYAAVKTDAPVYAELEVLPLSLSQVKKALSENALSYASDQALLDALHRDEHLAKAVETPFYLNTASFLFGKGQQRTWADFPFKSDSIEGRQAELIKIFVAEQVPAERDKKHLRTLAGQMKKEGFLVFELEHLQPDWCWNLSTWQWFFGLTYGLFASLVFGLIASLAGGLEDFWVENMKVNLIFGLIAGSIAGFSSGSMVINLQAIQTWSWRAFRRNWEMESIDILRSSLAIGLAFGLLYGFLFYWSGGPNEKSSSPWVLGFQIGLIVFGAFLLYRLRGAAINTTYQLNRPYQRFWATFRFALTITLFAFLVLGLMILSYFASKEDSVWEKLSDVIQFLCGWAITYVLSGLAIHYLFVHFLQHFALRLTLLWESKLPLRVVTFLDRITNQHIFEDNRRTVKGKKMRGTTWRFRHKILQDYFASMTQSLTDGPRNRVTYF